MLSHDLQHQRSCLTSLYLSPTSTWLADDCWFWFNPSLTHVNRHRFSFFFSHDVFMASEKTESGCCHSSLRWSGLVFNPTLDDFFFFFSSLVFRAWSIWAGWACSKTCQREHQNLPLSTTREPCTKPGWSVSAYERSFSKWGRSPQRSSSFYCFFFSRLICRITDAWTVTFAAPWRYQRRWGSTWRLQPLITGMTAKRLKRKKAFVCFIYDIMTLLWPCNHIWRAHSPETICTRPQKHSLKLDRGFKLLN